MTVSNRDARRAFAPAVLATCVLTQGFVCAQAAAQEAAAQPGAAQELDEINVIGRLRDTGWMGASDAVYDTPGGVAEIGREAIENRGGVRNAGDLFRGVPGVNAIINRQNPGVNVNIRGLQDQGRVNMSIDGARQNFQQAGHGAPNRAFVDTDFIRAVEIDKGPTSTAGGAGVIGGVVNFRTLDFDDIAIGGKSYGVKGSATTGTNAYDFNGSVVAAAKVSEAFEIVGGFGRKKLGEYDPGKRGTLVYGGPGDPPRFTSQDQWSWFLKGTARPDDHNKVTVSYTGLASDFGTGSGVFVDTDKVRTHNVVADWRYEPGSAFVDLAVKAYYSRTANDQFRPRRAADEDPVSVNYAIDTFGGSITNVSRFQIPFFDVALTYGGEVFHDKTGTSAVSRNPEAQIEFAGANPQGERTVGGGFARAEFNHGQWLQILTGVRYDRFQMNGDGVLFENGGTLPPTPFKVDAGGGRVLPTATVAVTPIKGVQLYTSYEEGYRPPNLMESILGGRHIGALPIYFAPNPDLKPEQSRTVEAGVNLKRDGVFAEDDAFRAKASVYRTGVDNFITQALYASPTGRYYTRNVNLDKRTVLKGVDLEANYDAGFAFIGASASFIDAKYKPSYDDGSSALPLTISGIELAPKRKITLDGGLRFFDRKLEVGARLTSVNPENDFDSSGAVLYEYKKYSLIDLYTSYKVSENLTIRGAVENIRDVAYVDALGAPLTPAPGRTFTIGATARF